ncbi:MAG: DUF2141 domain-containing protein [Deltaproteobacteria bacterium]|jgi:uncharacterized protein (DUF2141 family)
MNRSFSTSTSTFALRAGLGAALLVVPSLGSEPAAAQEPAGATLRVVLQGVRADRPGPLSCRLFRGAEGFPMGSPRSATRVVATREGGRATCVFAGLAPGTYAVAALHDHDADGAVDTNMFGAPTEGWATTNDVTHDFSPPSFSESSVTLTAEQTREVTARMHY